MTRIIIDTDPGQDDAVAMLLAFASPEIEVLGVTTVAGNVPLELTTRNALMICELAGRTDVPVHAGAAGPLPTVRFPDGESDPETDPPVPLLEPERLVAYVFTSGSTGAPIPHEKHWGMLVRNIRCEAERLAAMTRARICESCGLSASPCISNRKRLGMVGRLLPHLKRAWAKERVRNSRARVTPT